ncbi:MFS transporter [Aquimarina sp. RZ0]|uniref:MFS transporter n=1 Tax=Aquimarina sp. RZ0 TaxID=2607730 RepID=UPI0011F292F5|nr:MFS transporter [Aquimarina sp. RZ0]KAA1244164.1 MFS transporter [Aquimarina sp. RZ0]
MKKYYVYIGLLVISLMGTDLTDFALAIWVLDQPGATVLSYSSIWFFEAAPAVVFSVFVGSLVDRWDKKKMIIYGQLAAGIGSIVLFSLHRMDLLVPWHIMLVAGVGSISSMFVFQAFFVATRSLVSKSNLIKAQSLVGMCYGIMEIGIPILSPVLYKLIGIEKVFLIDIISFSISVIGFVFLGSIVVKRTSEPLSIKKDIALIKKFIKERHGFLYILMFSFISAFFLGLLMVLLTPLLLDLSDEYVLGLVYGFIGLGGFIGSVIMSKKKGINSPNRIIITLYGVMGLIVMFLFIPGTIYTITIIGIIILSLVTIAGILYNSFTQTIVPEEMLGRFSGMTGLFVGIAGPLSFLFSGFIVDKLGSLFKDSKYIIYYPGSEVAFSIFMLFAVMGLIIAVLSLFFKDHKEIKAIDILYAKELEISLNKNKVSE